ncbi:MAG: hypothetical protein R3C40_08350 [Parvularculaceae bacterium]
MTYTGSTVSAMQKPGASVRVKADAATAFILGNGPSLKGVDLKSLSDFPTFGMNAAYRRWRQIDWRPTYYICLDLVVGVSHAAAIADLIREGRIEKFLLRSNLIAGLGELAGSDRVVNFDALANADDIFKGVTITTGSGAALWAASLGYRQMVVNGVDGRYVEVVEGARQRDGIELEIVETSDNPNYFFDDYQQPGDRYNLPNPRPDLHVQAWREAAGNLAAREVRVFNANPNSAVRCFPFVEWAAYLDEGSEISPADEAPQSATDARHGGAQGRLRSFFRRHGAAVGLLAAVAVMGAAFAAAGRAPIVAALAIILASALAVAFMYGRYALVRHVNALQQEVTGLKARMAELERRAGGGG